MYGNNTSMQSETLDNSLRYNNYAIGIPFAKNQTRSFQTILFSEGLEMADEGNSAASSAIWAVALIIIVGLLALVVWKGGILSGPAEKKVDINVSAPSSR
jgi:hypothetical protein